MRYYDICVAMIFTAIKLCDIYPKFDQLNGGIAIRLKVSFKDHININSGTLGFTTVDKVIIC